jgi:hypothetical protein
MPTVQTPMIPLRNGSRYRFRRIVTSGIQFTGFRLHCTFGRLSAGLKIHLLKPPPVWPGTLVSRRTFSGMDLHDRNPVGYAIRKHKNGLFVGTGVSPS